MITRTIHSSIQKVLDTDKAIIIQGARQVGKTTLIKQLVKPSAKALWIDGDDPEDRLLWNNAKKQTLLRFVEGYAILIVDEAQRIENIGLSIKMIIDAKLPLTVVVSGSSSLNLASSINEPLTGRKWSFQLYPFSWSELKEHYSLLSALKLLDNFLVLGSYPEIITSESLTESRLKELATSYLYKDILEYGDIRKPELIVKLLRALAYQLGSEVSYHELGQLLQVDHKTVIRYIDLLEDSHVLFRLAPLSKNPRKEISTSRKIYFWDNGIRNAVINNFAPIDHRNDHGQLWENYIISEYHKMVKYNGKGGRLYFWRSKSSSEVDLIYENNGAYHAYEIKYNPKKSPRFAPSFLERYQPTITAVINRENFYDFLNTPPPVTVKMS